MNDYCVGRRWLQSTPEERQHKLTLNSIFEEDIFNESLRKYWDNYDRQPSLYGPEQALIHRVIDHIAESVELYLSELVKKNVSWVTPIVLLGPKRVAGLVITSCVDCLLSRTNCTIDGAVQPVLQQDLARNIANSIVLAVNYLESRQDHKGAWVLASKIVRQRWTPRQIRDFVKYHKSDGHIKLKNKERYYLGINMLMMLEKAKIIEFVKYWENPVTSHVAVRFTDTITGGLTDAHSDFLIRAKIRYRPMIVPPRKHTLDLSGGVHTEHLRKGVVDRGFTYFYGEDFVTEFKGSEPSQLVVDGLNALMATEWTINDKVLDIMDILFKANSRVANLPPCELDPVLLQEPTGITDPTELELVKKERKELWAEWYKKENERIRMCIRLSLAKDLQAYGFFYHVYTCDFRGRAYTITDLLSPQSGDQDRSLILFANPKRQTDRGMYWLKVHVANLFDQDKKSFDDRIKWVDQNINMLKAIHDNPIDNLGLWADDKKKKNQSFQRLAAVFELFRTDGMTQLPVGMDGSCNGIQHWSAISKDPVIGAMVNLLPSTVPQDAYGIVAAKVTEDMINTNDEWSRIFLDNWGGSISRSVVKRAVMTDPYGVTTRGISDGLLADGHLEWIDKRLRIPASKELTRYVQGAMNTLLTIPNKGKAWLKQVAKIASEKNVHLEWTTPCGFKVKHQYYGKTNHVIDIRTLTFRASVQFNEFLRDEVNGREAANGISPNYVHSLDASHMFLTIAGLVRVGVDSFSFIHDSYGTYATDIDMLRNETKIQFVKIHSVNQLEILRQQLMEYLGVGLPDVPSTGDLDINKVLESEYFFH